jgi:hypothetical protein
MKWNSKWHPGDGSLHSRIKNVVVSTSKNDVIPTIFRRRFLVAMVGNLSKNGLHNVAFRNDDIFLFGLRNNC